MTKLPFALSTAFLLSACSVLSPKQVFQECDGDAGHAELIDKNRYNGTHDDIFLVYDEKNGKHHEYRIDISAPNMVGESAVPLICETGTPDPRWKEMTP